MTSKIGIVGGGQLAAMLTAVCIDQGAECWVLDPDGNCPAVKAGASWLPGDSWDTAAMDGLADRADVITIEIEHVCLENLVALEQAGHRIVPNTGALARIIDKLEQKKHFASASLPTADFEAVSEGTCLADCSLGLPCVWKASRGGYDGRGVQIIAEDDAGGFVTPVDGFVEQFIASSMELAVMVAVDDSAGISTWNPAELIPCQQTNMLEHLVSPARVPEKVLTAARELATKAVRSFESPGIFGVEMFLALDGTLLINEISPRTHNSGHYTMDACRTSQFEQQFRVLTGEPLGPTSQLSPAVMSNILGARGYRGRTVVENLHEVNAMPDTHVHIYGKEECFDNRKMGHMTFTAESIPEAIDRMHDARSKLIVRGEQADG